MLRPCITSHGTIRKCQQCIGIIFEKTQPSHLLFHTQTSESWLSFTSCSLLPYGYRKGISHKLLKITEACCWSHFGQRRCLVVSEIIIILLVDLTVYKLNFHALLHQSQKSKNFHFTFLGNKYTIFESEVISFP